MTQQNFNIQPNVNNSSVVLAVTSRNEVELVCRTTFMGREINIYGSVENPLFLASEVSEWIEHSDASKMLLGIDEEEKLKRTLFVSGQRRECNLLTEDGLYEVFMQSRKPIAKQFKKGLKQILKDIRKQGYFVSPVYQTTTTQQPTYSLEDKFKAIDLSCKMLRVSKASKARMINSVIAPMGLPVFDYIESEGACLSAKDLLEKHKVEYRGKALKSASFNTIMEEHGYIERIERSTKDGSEKFPVLTEKGLKWGKNDEPTQGHHGKVQPRYYVNKFPQLLKELGLLQKGE